MSFAENSHYFTMSFAKNTTDNSVIDDMLKVIATLAGGERSGDYSFVHCKVDREIPLVGRSKILDSIRKSWSEREKSRGGGDRTLFSLPVCVGVPGAGKTRLLEEWKTVFQTMVIPDSNSLGILVPYFNGHGVREIETQYSTERTFVWRLLHRYFLEDIVLFSTFMDTEAPKLPDITLIQAILVVCKYSSQREGFNVDERTSIFIGVDEFQTIPDNNTEIGVPRLVNLIVDAAIQLRSSGINVYSMFAGTEWGKIGGIGSSNSIVKRISIPFFDSDEKLQIAVHINPRGCRSEAFVENLHQVGDIARCAVEFCQKSLLSESVLGTDELGELASDIEQLHCRQWRENLNRSDLMNLVAFGMSGISVLPAGLPSVPILASSPQQLTWQQLADRGLFNLTPHRSNWFVRIPSIVIRACSSETINNDTTPIEVAFLKTLQLLIALPSMTLDPWQKWEQFGAYFHCLRINSLLLLGISSCTFSTLCPTANTQMEVNLRPAFVFCAAEELNTETNLENLTENRNILKSVNLLDDKCENCHVILNCRNGNAADIYFALQESGSNRWVLFIDQRKRDCIVLTTGVIKGYHDRMTALRKSDPNLILITGLFSALIGYGKKMVKKPINSVVLSKEELREYHCSFADHPSVSTLIDIHLCNRSLLTAILGSVLSKYVKDLIKHSIFPTFESLNRALNTTHKCTIGEEFRNQLFFMTKENSLVPQDAVAYCSDSHDDDSDDEIPFDININ